MTAIRPPAAFVSSAFVVAVVDWAVSLGCGVVWLPPPEQAVSASVDVARTAADYGTEPIWFPGMGHDVMLDRGWEDVLATVLDFAGHLPAWGTAPPR